MNNDLISREALKEKLAECGYDIADFGGLFFIIDNAPPVSDRYSEGYSQGYIDGSTGADWEVENDN